MTSIDPEGVRLFTVAPGVRERISTIIGEPASGCYVTVVSTAGGGTRVVYPPGQDPRITARLLGDGDHWAHCPGCKHCKS